MLFLYCLLVGFMVGFMGGVKLKINLFEKVYLVGSVLSGVNDFSSLDELCGWLVSNLLC